MRMSVITITKDDGVLLRRNVSVEHLIVNGGQPLCNISRKRCCTVLKQEPHGIYNAINYGISKASDDVIGVVHGNDFLADNYLFSIPWYCILGMVLYFMLFCIWRAPVEITKILIMGGVALSATAYVTGGSVSRYVLPWIPFLIPSASFVIVSGAWRRLSFRWFAVVFGLLVCAALIVVYLTLQPYYARGCVSY